MNYGRELLKPPSPDTRCQLGVIISAVLGGPPRQPIIQQVQRLQAQTPSVLYNKGDKGVVILDGVVSSSCGLSCTWRDGLKTWHVCT